MNEPKSAYNISPSEEKITRHTFAVIVDNRPGILSRVVGMFSGRGYNIESLTVSSIDKNKKRSRISVVTTGNKQIIQQIGKQLKRIVAVNSAHSITDCEHIEKEIILVKIKTDKHNKQQFIACAEKLEAETVYKSDETFIFMVVGDNKNIKQFMQEMSEIGEVEIARSGAVAMSCEKQILQV